MHTALRIGTTAADEIRALNPRAHLCFFGLYASLHADWLLESGRADSVIGGEYEAALVALTRALQEGSTLAVTGVSVRGRKAAPILQRLPFPTPSRRGPAWPWRNSSSSSRTSSSSTSRRTTWTGKPASGSRSTWPAPRARR